MTERMRESLSALLDNEANELEMERVLKHVADDDSLRQTWVRYNLVRAVTAGQPGGYSNQHLGIDISAGVREAIGSSSWPGASRESLGRRLLRPLASVAVAASVAATVVIGGQQLAYTEATSFDPGQSVASSASPVGLLNSLGATPVRASYGTQPMPVLQPATRTAYQELARQRMQTYIQEHAEHAALNSPQGLIPFARVPTIKE